MPGALFEQPRRASTPNCSIKCKNQVTLTYILYFKHIRSTRINGWVESCVPSKYIAPSVASLRELGQFSGSTKVCFGWCKLRAVSLASLIIKKKVTASQIPFLVQVIQPLSALKPQCTHPLPPLQYVGT